MPSSSLLSEAVKVHPNQATLSGFVAFVDSVDHSEIFIGTVQALVCEWLGEAFEEMAASGVASRAHRPGQRAADVTGADSALTDALTDVSDADRGEDPNKDPGTNGRVGGSTPRMDSLQTRNRFLTPSI